MKDVALTIEQYMEENHELQMRLEEAEDTLRAIRCGEIDALIIERDSETQIYTLSNADEPYRILIQEMNEGAVTLTREGLILFANRCFADMIKMPLEAIIGVSIYNFINLDAQDSFAALLIQSEIKKSRCEMSLLASDGTLTPAYLSLSLSSTGGLKKYYFLVATNLTKIKEVERNRQQELLRLDKLSLVGAVAAGIGHEVRNPMTTVRGFLQLLATKEECSNYNDYFSLMIEELDRANLIITDFLSLAKDKVVELEMLNLKEIVENIFPLIQADGLISDKYIHLELDEVSEILIDRKEIHQLILNLVLNGSQAMSPGGTMKIRTFMDKEEIVLAVQDDGKGITQDVLEKIGTPFFTTKENGTGLGLAVCYSIVARHNAKIDIETGSTGTTFFVRFKK